MGWRACHLLAVFTASGLRSGAQARGVPRQAAERDEPPRRRLGLARRLLVVDLEEAVGREHRAPVIHQPQVLPVVRDARSPRSLAKPQFLAKCVW